MEKIAMALRQLQTAYTEYANQGSYSFQEMKAAGRMIEDMGRILPAWARTADGIVTAKMQAEQPAEQDVDTSSIA